MAYFAPFIDAAGYHVPTYGDILADMLSGYRSVYPQVVYLGTDTAKYQEISIFALKVYDTNLGSQLAYNARSPLTAVGSALDTLGKLTATARLLPSYSSAPVLVSGVAGTTITNGTVTDTSGNVWALPQTVTIPGGGSVVVSVVCQTLGAIQAAAGAINQISGGANAGWVSAVNPSAAVPGLPTESDSAYRGRMYLSTSLPSKTRLAATIARVAAVSGVTRYASGILSPDGTTTSVENPTSAVDYFGNPPHSVTMVVEGGADLDVATAIFSNRGIGPYTNGSVQVPVTDPDSGVITLISFYRPTYLPVYVAMTVHGLSGYSAAVLTSIQSAIVTYLNSLQIGETLTYSSLYSVAQSVMPSLLLPQFSVRSLFTGTTAGPTGTVDITPAFNAVVSGATANVSVTAV